MLNIDNKGYIPKSQPGDSLYENLHQEGIELLQKLAGSVWTDYNEHDPGITILENLIYALTELDYKASLPVKDLLIQSDGAQLQSGQGGLYIASEILTTTPVTLLDYRKLFIDAITNVKNVWIIYKRTKAEHDKLLGNCKGLYHVYVEMYEYKTEEKQARQEEDRIKNELRVLYNANRNLCEDLYDVTVYKPVDFDMKYEISLNNEAQAEDIAAQILFEVNAYLTSDVKYYSLWELQNEGMPVEQIFNGPRLESGFITDDNLTKRIKQIVLADVINLISNIEGVSHVSSFSLTVPDPGKIKGLLNIGQKIILPPNYAPALAFPQTNSNLVFANNGIRYRPNLEVVKSKWMDFRTIEYRSFRTVSKAVNEITIPQGDFLNAGSYLSVRHQFPTVYGIGTEKLPDAYPVIRHAQANQLKAYLLPLDQLMANYLEQLSQFHTLYDTENQQTSSYFYQRIPDMKNIKQLINADKLTQDKNISEQDLLALWDQEMESLNTQSDIDALKRLNQLADNILARFSEEFNTYFLRKINDICYGDNFTDENFERDLLNWKRKLIWYYGKISYGRTKAYDYSTLNATLSTIADFVESPDEDVLTPGLIRKLTILMGIDNCLIRPLTPLLSQAGISGYDLKDTLKIVAGTSEFSFSARQHNESNTAQADTNKKANIFFDIGNKKDSILKSVLRNGVLKSNYTIALASTDTNRQAGYSLSFIGDKGIKMLYNTSSRQEAQDALDNLVSNLCSLNKTSEGIFLIEHILLVPPFYENFFGLKIDLSKLDKRIETNFVSAKLQPMNERNADAAILVSQLFAGTLEMKVSGVGTVFQLEITDKKNHTLVVSEKKYSNSKECEQLMSYLKTLSSSSISFPLSALAFLAYYPRHHVHHHHHHHENEYHHHYHAVEETFFSFRMSFVLPDWPVRFQNINFKNKFENLVYEQTPAHIASSLCWLEVDQMGKFESMYYNLIDALGKTDSVKNRMEYAHQLISFLKDYQQ